MNHSLWFTHPPIHRVWAEPGAASDQQDMATVTGCHSFDKLHPMAR